MRSRSVSPRARCRLPVAVGFVLLVGAVPATTLAQPNQPGGSGFANTVAHAATGAALADATPEVEQEAPLTAGRSIRPPDGFVPEPRFIARPIKLLSNRLLAKGGQLNNGFYPEFSNMITGSGWVSIGPGYRHWLFGDRAIVDASTALSWRMYKTAQGRFEFTNLARSRLAVGSQVRWQDLTQVSYFGPGPESLEADHSQYRMKSTDVVAYATVRPMRSLAIVGRVGWLNSPTILPPGGTFKNHPDTRTVFPDDQVYALDEQPSFLHGEASFTSDTRDSRSRPSSGGVYRAAWTAYSDRDAGAFSFRRYEAEAAQFVPLTSGRVVLALHAWVVASDTDAGGELPFYLMPTLGGSNTMRAYSEYRFQDRNLLVATVESRFALTTHVDVAGFVDAGDVAPRLSGLDLGKTSYGLGVRVHTERATFGRLDVAHGAEGWRFLFRTSDPLHLSRLSRRTAAAPFVP